MSNPIALTQRHYEIIKNAIEYLFSQFPETRAEQIDYLKEKFDLDGGNVLYEVDFNYENDQRIQFRIESTDELLDELMMDDEDRYPDEDIIPEISLSIIIYRKKIGYEIFKGAIIRGRKVYGKTLKKLEKYIGKVYHKCILPNCDDNASDGFQYCESDYIFYHTREDNCPICFENGGSWTNLKCNGDTDHIFHTSCLHSLRKCPLCRCPINYKKIIMNCVFIEGVKNVVHPYYF